MSNVGSKPELLKPEPQRTEPSVPWKSCPRCTGLRGLAELLEQYRLMWTLAKIKSRNLQTGRKPGRRLTQHPDLEEQETPVWACVVEPEHLVQCLAWS